MGKNIYFSNMYEPVIGLEIHLQVQTNSKMFCRCPNNCFEQKPNTYICPVCVGLPGALPVPNKFAFEQAIRLALALHCDITKETKFDRKNYFYPDLPKGYQITQFDTPLGTNGYVQIELEGDVKRFRIKRLHLEEDTAKSLHFEGKKTLIDFNKSGIPLIEIVTAPDFVDKKEVTSFAKRLRQIIRYIGISEGEMQKGQIRFELNMSLRTPEQAGSSVLPDYKIEVKNIGSISVLEKVIDFEYLRQKNLLENGKKIVSETRGLKNMTGETVFQRYKESSDDYRYFTEPDIPPIKISDDWINYCRKSLPILPAEKKYYYLQLGLENDQADFLVEEKNAGEWFDKLIITFFQGIQFEFRFVNESITEAKEILKNLPYNPIKESVKWFMGDVLGLMEKKSIKLEHLPINQQHVLDITNQVKNGKITGTIAKDILNDLFNSQFQGKTIDEIVLSQNLTLNNDMSAIEVWVTEAIEQNQDIVESCKKNPNAIKALVGKVMQLSKGKANPKMVEQAISDKIFINK